jgi:hypothetical protein
LTEAIRSGYRILAPSELTSKEKVLLRLLNDRKFCSWKDRQISIGLSETANGWTDGASYIALDRHYLDTSTIRRIRARRNLSVCSSTKWRTTKTRRTRTFMARSSTANSMTSAGDNTPQALIADFYRRINDSKVAKQHEDQLKRDQRTDAKKDSPSAWRRLNRSSNAPERNKAP